MATRTVLMAAILVLLAGLALAPAARAATTVTATVRVEAAPYEVAPTTNVTVSPSGVFTDSLGNVYKPGHASALGALAGAAKARGLSWEAGYGGDFIVNIGGFTSLPDFSQGWIYAVNGAGYPVPALTDSAIAFKLRAGDKVLFAQYPDGTFTVGTKLLVVRFEKRGYLPGEAITITVLGDDLAKVNSAADATRFGSGNIETPAQFAPVDGATVHIGVDTYVTDAQGKAKVPAASQPPFALTGGTYTVWAEKAMDSSFAYVRSPRSQIDIGFAPELSSVKTNASFTRGVGRLTVRYTLSKGATVRLVVKNSSGKVVYTNSSTHMTGPGITTWSGKTKSGSLVSAGTYSCTLAATDRWGRTSAEVPFTVEVK